MGKGRGSLHPLSICRRFFNFIMNNLIGHGIKHVTLGRAGSESVEVPIEASSRNVKINGTGAKRLPKSNGEIVVEFRHIEALENGSPAHFPRQNGLTVVSDDHGTLVQNGVTRKKPGHSQSATEKTDAGFGGNNYKGPREIKQSPITRGKGPRTIIPVKESAGDRVKEDKISKKNKQDQKDVAIHQSGDEPDDPMPMPQRPLTRSGASNINEEATAFIQSRTEAMRQALQP